LRANRAAAATRAPPRGGAGSRRHSPIPPPSRPVVAGAASEQWAGLLYKDGQMSTILNYSRRRILPRVRLEVSIRLLSLLLERELDYNILAHTRPHPPRLRCQLYAPLAPKLIPKTTLKLCRKSKRGVPSHIDLVESRRPSTCWPSNGTSRRAESRATGHFDGVCMLHEAAECHRHC